MAAAVGAKGTGFIKMRKGNWPQLRGWKILKIVPENGVMISHGSALMAILKCALM